MKSAVRTIVASSAAVGAALLMAPPAYAAQSFVSTPTQHTLVATPDLRPGGSFQYVDGGLVVAVSSTTLSENKVQLAFPQPTSFPLADLGELDVTATGDGGYPNGPGLNIFVDLDGDASTLEGILVFEEIYGQDLWVPDSPAFAALTVLAPDNSGGNGSGYHGTLAAWLQAIEDAQLTATVLGVALNYGSGIPESSWTISSVTFAETTYTFDLDPEESLPQTGSDLPLQLGIAGAAVVLIGGLALILTRRRTSAVRA